jgi:hypothetical protein
MTSRTQLRVRKKVLVILLWLISDLLCPFYIILSHNMTSKNILNNWCTSTWMSVNMYISICVQNKKKIAYWSSVLSSAYCSYRHVICHFHGSSVSAGYSILFLPKFLYFTNTTRPEQQDDTKEPCSWNNGTTSGKYSSSFKERQYKVHEPNWF